MKSRPFLLLVLFILVSILIIGLIIFFQSRANQPQEITSLRRLKIEKPPPPFFSEGESPPKSIVDLGEFEIWPADEEKGIEERVLISGYVIEPPRLDKERGQIIARLGFPTAKDETRADVFFGASDEKVGIRWAPEGDVEANKKWEITTAGQVAKKIKKGDQVIFYVPLEEGAKVLINDIKTGSGEQVRVIGPIIQIIVGLY